MAVGPPVKNGHAPILHGYKRVRFAHLDPFQSVIWFGCRSPAEHPDYIMVEGHTEA